MFCSFKDKIPTHQKSNIIYTINCPGCGEGYVRKTDICVITRLNEHTNRSNQPMFQHLLPCDKFLETMTLYNYLILILTSVLLTYKTVLLAQFLIFERS